MRNILLLALLPHFLTAQSTEEIRQAVMHALPALEHSAAAFTGKRACVSCHHNILPILMFRLAHERGIPFDAGVLDAVEAKTFQSLRGPSAFKDAVEAVSLNDPTPNDSFLLMAADAAGLAPDLTTAVYARRLTQWQRDGHWVTSDFRPPHSSSLFTATATAVRAISLYMPEELRAERDACILRGRRWLFQEKPASTEDAAFRLMGLVWAGASTVEIGTARRDLLAMRDPSGAWPELSGYPADAYSTGESLFALHEAGGPVPDGALHFLVSTEAADGTWRVHTRMLSPAEVSPAYFTTGFPYEKDEYLSYAGSVWATMALLAALPEARSAVHPVIQSDAGAPWWARTVLFGTPQELNVLLDKGLDPNSAIPMAAPDAEKVRILLAHGATASYAALTIAASSRGTAQAIQRLLEAGVPVNPPEGVRTKNTPLQLASMTGDPENVKLLLAHGAGLTSALAQAVTFGYADIVRTLIAAGAPANLTDGSGINLLHWAAIANRPTVIPLLVEAGVSINAQDEFGFTPVMYAATIDFGDTASLRELLKAGADPNIRNADGRTALEQARYYQHARFASVLEK